MARASRVFTLHLHHLKRQRLRDLHCICMRNGYASRWNTEHTGEAGIGRSHTRLSA